MTKETEMDRFRSIAASCLDGACSMQMSAADTQIALDRIAAALETEVARERSQQPSSHSKSESEFDRAVRRACQELTLVEALTSIAVWETERVVKQARMAQVDPNTGAQWDTCFKYCFQAVIDKWEQGSAARSSRQQ